MTNFAFMYLSLKSFSIFVLQENKTKNQTFKKDKLCYLCIDITRHSGIAA